MKTLDELIELSEKEVKFREYLRTKYDLNRECKNKKKNKYKRKKYVKFLARWAWTNAPLDDHMTENKLKVLCITWNMAGQVFLDHKYMFIIE